MCASGVYLGLVLWVAISGMEAPHEFRSVQSSSVGHAVLTLPNPEL